MSQTVHVFLTIIAAISLVQMIDQSKYWLVSIVLLDEMEWVGVRQGCLLSPTLFNIFLERITTGALEDHKGTVSNGGRTITNLHFADDMDGLAREEELTKLVEHLDKASTAYGIEW